MATSKLTDKEMNGALEDLKIKNTKYINFYRELDYVIKIYS